MIDMVFLLLIFFVVNATAITVKKDKNIQMPTASSSGEVKSANGCIVVNVYGEGAGKRPPGVDPSVLWSSDVGTPLNSSDELKEYIKNLVERFKDRQDFETAPLSARRPAGPLQRVPGGNPRGCGMRCHQSDFCRSACQEFLSCNQG